MKKSQFSLLILILLSFPILAQETKQKLPANTNSDRVAFELNIAENKIFTENAPIGKKIMIFSVVGIKVSEIEIKTSSGEYDLNIPKGYYFVKISNSNIVRKVVIR